MKSVIATFSWSATAGADVCVCGVGARTPLGFTANASAAAVRGAISALATHPSFVDKADEPMTLARDAGLDIDMEITFRMQQMLVSATAEAVGGTFSALGAPQFECWIGLPEPRPGLPPDIGGSVSSASSSAFGFPSSAIHVLPRGNASGLMAIQAATQKVSSGETDFCVAIGVDSYHDLNTLEWLDQNRRLMSSRNRNGFPPGEAAGACLLARRSTANRYGLPIMGCIMAATTCVEPHTILTAEVCTGDGLGAALKSVASCLDFPEQAFTATYCDLNGERYRNEEFLYALLRVQDTFVNAHDYQCPADCWGDVGAASGPLFACLAIESNRRGYAKGLYPVLWAGSESGHRTVVVLRLGDS